MTTEAQLEQLELLLAELESDVLLCTTRDQHIRAVQRVNRLTSVLEHLRMAQ